MIHKINRGHSTHSDKLEKWLGTERVNALSLQFGGFYYPIKINGIPGDVYVMPGGDFAGEIKAGSFMSKEDAARLTIQKIAKKLKDKKNRNKATERLIELLDAEDSSLVSLGAFASIDAIVAAYTGGKGHQMNFAKTGVASNAIGNSNDLWTRAGQPVAGAAASAAPGGVVPTSSSTGALGFINLGTADTSRYLNWSLSASVINNSLLLYDRIFAVAKTMNSTATEAVTGTPNRFNSTTSSDAEYCAGNFCFPANPTTVLAATAHNWTVCQYTDQGGATGNSFPSATGVSACVVGGIDLAAGQNSWFMPLASGDIGISALTQMQCSAAVATGTIDFVLAHPIAINSCPVANLSCLDDGLYTTINLHLIPDSACLSFIELPKPATTATTYSGIIRVVSE